MSGATRSSPTSTRNTAQKRTALAAAVVTYRGRSALREVAKAMGLSDDVRGALSGSIWGWSSAELGEKEAKAGGLDQADPLSRHVIERANEIMGFPRHLSQHVGGFVITRDRLDEIVPIVKTAMDERKMVEWDKDDLDAVGILKVDVLALGMLSCLRRAFDLLEQPLRCPGRPAWPARRAGDHAAGGPARLRHDLPGRHARRLPDRIARPDVACCRACKPREFYDLVIEVAIVRPGPIQGDMVHPYLRRRQGKEEAGISKPELKQILAKTLGVPLFQEQAMKIAIEAGGFTPGEADQLRRAMATFKRTGTIGNYRERMIEGMVRARLSQRDFAERCFKQIEGFRRIRLSRKAMPPPSRCWSMPPAGSRPSIPTSSARRSSTPSRWVFTRRHSWCATRATMASRSATVDVNLSDWDCTLEEAAFDPARRSPARHAEMRGVIRTRHAVRLGFRQIKGLAEEAHGAVRRTARRRL